MFCPGLCCWCLNESQYPVIGVWSVGFTSGRHTTSLLLMVLSVNTHFSTTAPPLHFIHVWLWRALNMSLTWSHLCSRFIMGLGIKEWATAAEPNHHQGVGGTDYFVVWNIAVGFIEHGRVGWHAQGVCWINNFYYKGQAREKIRTRSCPSLNTIVHMRQTSLCGHCFIYPPLCHVFTQDLVRLLIALLVLVHFTQ